MKVCSTPGCGSMAINDDPLQVWCDVCLREETIKDLRAEVERLREWYRY